MDLSKFNPLAVKAQKKSEFVKAFESRLDNPAEVYDKLVKEAKPVKGKK